MIQKLCSSVGTGAVEGDVGLSKAGLVVVIIRLIVSLKQKAQRQHGQHWALLI